MRTATLFALYVLVSPTWVAACPSMLRGSGISHPDQKEWNYSINLDRGKYDAVQIGGGSGRIEGGVQAACDNRDIFLEFEPTSGGPYLCRFILISGSHYNGFCYTIAPEGEINLNLDE